ncbi:hypothetical protein [Longitalea luteola]|uniref:hypothetical protein n=1 Tax=Longitalea luteola TaxID=2812563 RepID=UPI001A96DB61|nr:hypothetical protein [Longitalea luteola]
MWKSLAYSQRVCQGDKIRFNNAPREVGPQTLFQVVKADEHYFEVCPISQECDTLLDLVTKKIVRYFDLGYYVQAEIWNDE